MNEGERSSRPRLVTFTVVLMYAGGIAQVALGILTIFLRYAPEAKADGLMLTVSLFGAGMILFGLFIIALASGVARGSRASRLGATAVMLLGLVLAVADLVVAADNDWSGVIIQGVAAVAVIVALWAGPGRRYFLTG